MKAISIIIKNNDQVVQETRENGVIAILAETRRIRGRLARSFNWQREAKVPRR